MDRPRPEPGSPDEGVTPERSEAPAPAPETGAVTNESVPARETGAGANDSAQHQPAPTPETGAAATNEPAPAVEHQPTPETGAAVTDDSAPSAEQESVPATETSAGATSDSAPTAEQEPAPATETSAGATSESVPVAEHQPAPETGAAVADDSAPTAEQEPVPATETGAAANDSAQHQPAPAPETDAAATNEPAPATEHQPTPATGTAATNDSAPTTEQEPAPATETGAAATYEPIPTAEPAPAPNATEPYAEFPTYPVAQIPTSVWAAPEPDPAQWAPHPLQFQQPKPVLPPPVCDPLAVALANASFLGAGYLMLRRRLFAALSLLVTLALVITLVTLRSIWVEIALVLWWAAMIAHGWFLARPGKPVKKQRLIAAALAIPVVLSVSVLRFDTVRVENRIDEAKAAGDCGAAVTAVDGLWSVHTIANAPMIARSDATKQTCQQLDEAAVRMATALREGDAEELKRGFDALKVAPGHEKMADRTRDAFLDRLPSDDPCHTSTITDWLKQNTDRREVVERVAPKALVECADMRMKATDHTTALQRYQQFLKDYPGHELTQRAQAGEQQAKLAIELASVRALLQSDRYCDNPGQYSGAPAYGKGVNKSIVVGNDEYAARLGDWRVSDPSEAALIVCAGKTEMGAATQTCPYESRPGSPVPAYVTFKKIAIPVRAFELKTGKLVAETRVEIGGTSCPPILQYRYRTLDTGPPSEVHVTASDADVRNGFAPVISP